MKKLLILTLLFLGFIQLRSQTIDIGQDADYIKKVIEFTTKDHNIPDSYGNSSSSRIKWDVVYKNGKIADVLQCFNGQYNIDLRMNTDYCKHYMMVNGKLAFILTQFENVSVEKLKEAYKDIYKGFIKNDLYFEKDLEYYSKIYLGKNGNATIELRRAEISELPMNLRSSIESAQKIFREEKRQEIIYKEKEAKKIEETKKITYDLEKYKKTAYDSCKSVIKKHIEEYVVNISKYIRYRKINPNAYSRPVDEDEMKVRFKNLYRAYFKLEDHRRPSQQIGNIYIAGSTNNIKIIKELTLLSGTDTDCFKFKNMCIEKIPEIKIKGDWVMTEAKFDSINVDYYKGVTLVKVKDGNIEFLEYYPDLDVLEKIKNKMKNEKNGKYLVYYYLSDIMGDKKENIEFEKVKFQLM